MIAGPSPSVGKSFVSVNLATVLTANDKNVLLIDGDLRRGHLHEFLGVERKLAAILFADVVDSSRLVAGMDPEDADEQLLAALQVMTDAGLKESSSIVRQGLTAAAMVVNARF